MQGTYFKTFLDLQLQIFLRQLPVEEDSILDLNKYFVTVT